MGIEKAVRHDKATGKDLVASETNPTYAAMIETVDQSVGQVVEKLKAIGEYDNTLFVFFSDNGSTTDSVPCVPLNGGKNSTYEAGVRVPAFVKWKGEIKPGSEYNHPVYLGDVFNTILEATGQTPAPDADCDGVSLFPVFAGKRLAPREFVWYFPDTREKWAQRANAAIYDEKSGLKYFMYFTGDEDELYNIGKDIGETTNIIAQHPEAAKQLRGKLRTFLNRYYPDMPKPPKNYKDKTEARLAETG